MIAEYGGDNTSCAGCDGVANSGLTVDDCGVCGGDNSSCTGCDGVANSGLTFDDCGVCGGSGPDAGFDCEGNSLTPEPYVTISLTDSWGDGWNGNTLTVGGVEYSGADLFVAAGGNSAGDSYI